MRSRPTAWTPDKEPDIRAQRATMRASGTALKTLKATIGAAQDAFGTLSDNWAPHLLRTAEAQFATDCEGCAGCQHQLRRQRPVVLVVT